mgnify:CR=1 FL=1|jgi:hypothetical protein
MSQQADKLNEMVEGILAQLRLRLSEAINHPQPGGKKVIIHIAPDRGAAWIELPPEVVEVKVRHR